jgi:hypothetical protein
MNQLWEVYIQDRFYSGIIKPSPNHNRLFTKIKQICEIFLRVYDTRVVGKRLASGDINILTPMKFLK